MSITIKPQRGGCKHQNTYPVLRQANQAQLHTRTSRMLTGRLFFSFPFSFRFSPLRVAIYQAGLTTIAHTWVITLTIYIITSNLVVMFDRG